MNFVLLQKNYGYDFTFLVLLLCDYVYYIWKEICDIAEAKDKRREVG